MMRGRRCALLALALLLAAVSRATGADAPPAELPVYAVGDQWVLTEATYRLDRLQRDAYVFVAEGGREIWLGRDLGLRYVKRGSESIEVDPPPGLTWPLTVGRRGGRITFVRFRGSEIGEVEVQSSWRVMDFEDVEVAGRKVPAFRIVYQLDPEIPGRFRDNPYQKYGPLARSAKFDYTVWYAPAVRGVVREERRAQYVEKGGDNAGGAATIRTQYGTVELVSFTPGG